MLPRKPFLFRAFYQWIVDSESTPYVVVDTTFQHVEVPMEFIQNNQIVLNVKPEAVKDLQIENQYLRFSATFGGVEEDIYVPMIAIKAVYAKENGAGHAFEDAFDKDSDHPLMQPVSKEEALQGEGGSGGGKDSGPHLKIIK